MAAVELNEVELKILRHYFTGWKGGFLLQSPEAAIRHAMQSLRGGSSLWPDGPAYETTVEGVVLRRGLTGPRLAMLRWTRVKAWVESLPESRRSTVVAAEHVVNKRHAAITDHGDLSSPAVRAWQEACHVRDAALTQCFDHQLQTAPALFETEMPLAR